MRTVDQTFTGSLPLAIAGKLLRILEASAPVDVTIFSESGQSVALQMAGGYYCKPSGGFSRVDFYSASSVRLKVLISDDDGGMDVVSVVGQVLSVPVKSKKITDLPAVTVRPLEVCLVLEENLSRVEARFKNAGASVVYLGGAGLNSMNAVVSVEPGKMWVEEAGAAARWYAMSGAAEGTVRIQTVG